MNSFLTPLTNAILDRKGTIDKYIGDAIMAFWNAPLDDAKHEINACEAALDMQDRVKTLNKAREEEAKANGTRFIQLNVGVGLNSGPCVVGNMGSDLRFDYSVLGDTVNLASRLEGQSKNYGVPIIVGSKTATQAARQIRGARARLHHREGQDRAGIRLHGSRPRRCRRQRAVWPVAPRRQRRCSHSSDNVTLPVPQARLRGAVRSRTALVSTICSIFMTSASGRSNSDPPPADWNGVFVLDSK